MKKILFVCGNPPHPVHEKFAKSIGADFFYYGEENFKERIRNIRKIPKGYDIYLSEGLFSYVVLARAIGHIKKDAKIINLFADPRVFQIVTKKKFDLKNLVVKKYSSLKRKLMIWMIKKLDGAICVGKFEEELLKKINKQIPSRNVPAFVTRNEFFRFKSNLKENNLLFIAIGPDYYYKGLDFLINIFLRVRETNKNSKLLIIGDGWGKFKKLYEKNKSIIFLGKKNIHEIKEIMNKCSLFCLFGRGDTFPVVTIESMAAGMPCMVSNTTGTKEIIEKISKDFVIDMEKPKEVVKKINDCLKKSRKEKLILGEKFRKSAKFYNEKNCTNAFKAKFDEIINEIYQ